MSKRHKKERRPLRARLLSHPVFRFFFAAPIEDEYTEMRRNERARLRTARVLAAWRASRLRRLVDLLRGTLFMTSPRALSLFLLPLALATTFRCLLLPMLSDDFTLLLADGIAGAVLLLPSLLLVIEGAPIYLAADKRPLLSRLLFGTLSLPRPYRMPQRGLPAWLLLIPGVGLAALSLEVPPLYLILFLVGIAALAFSLSSPDFPLLLVSILLPLTALLPQATRVLAAVLLVTALAYAIKLLLGKRLFRFEALDLLVLLFAVAILLAGFFSTAEGGLAVAFSMAAVVLLGYFLTANLITTRRSILLLARGMLFVATPLAALGVFRGISSLIDPGLSRLRFVSYVCGISDRIFSSPAVLASYFLLLFPLLFFVLSETERLRWRYIPALLLLPAAVGLTLRPTAYLALVLSLLLFALLNSRVRPHGILLLFAVLPSFLFLLPEEAMRRLAALFSVVKLEEQVLSALFRMQIGARAFVGELAHPFGLGTGHSELSLRAFFAGYGRAASDGGSLYLTMGVQLGVVGLSAFLLLLVFALRDAMQTMHVEDDNRYRSPAVGVTCSMMTALLLSPYENIFANHRILLLFFLLLGLMTAIRRAARYEDVVLLRAQDKNDRELGNVSIRLGRAGARR